MLLDRSRINIASNPSEDILKKCTVLISHKGDAQVIGSARENKADYFVTLDRKHFLDNKLLKDKIPLHVGTPGDFLAWFRGRFTTSHAN